MEKNKGGRPLKEIDKKNFESLCSLMCTKPEICNFLGVEEKTLTRWCMRTYKESFAEIYKKKSANGTISLRRNQFKLSEKSAVMAIWLGKQYLGQQDHIVVEETQDEKVIELLTRIKEESEK